MYKSSILYIPGLITQGHIYIYYSPVLFGLETTAFRAMLHGPMKSYVIINSNPALFSSFELRVHLG